MGSDNNYISISLLTKHFNDYLQAKQKQTLDVEYLTCNFSREARVAQFTNYDTIS